MSRVPSLRLRVAEVITETPDACSFVFDSGGHDVEQLAYRPGQFLTLNIPTDRPGGARGAIRCPVHRSWASGRRSP